jgi:predicted transcriptional regulator
MPKKELVDKLSIYVPKSKASLQPVERLMKIGTKKDRSVNYLVVEAILEYLDRHENKS